MSRMVRRSFRNVLIGLLLLLPCFAVRAQLPAEAALAASDWPLAVERAEAALAAGGLPVAQWTQLQRVLGIARARLGEGEQARRAFICALALEPGLRLSSGEVVEVRSPFMEARGFWSEQPDRLSATATLSEDQLALIVSLVDPAALTARVLVRVRAVGQSQFVEFSFAPSSSFLVPLDALKPTRGVEFSLALIDENANRLWALGSDAQPERQLREPAGGVSAPAAPRTATEVQRAPSPRSPLPFYIGASAALVVAAGATTVAAVSHAERERLARHWNRAECDGEGATRGDVCAREHKLIMRYQRLAWGLYAAGAAGILAGVVTLVAAPTRTRRDRAAAPKARALRCGPGPGALGLECGATF